MEGYEMNAEITQSWQDDNRTLYAMVATEQCIILSCVLADGHDGAHDHAQVVQS